MCVDTRPANGSVVEIRDGRETDLLCQFTVPFGNEVVGSVRWFLNQSEAEETQVQGIELAIDNRTRVDEREEGLVISSTLTLLVTVADLPIDLVSGRISCFLDNEPNPFGLFNAILVLRTG